MRTSKTFSIRFWVNPKKAKNNNALLYARITVNQKRVEISLKRKVPLDLWDGKNKKVLGHSSEAKQINQYLEETRVLLFQIFQDLKYQGELITAKKIKTIFLGEDESSKTLLELIDYHSKKIENTHATGSIRNYGVTEEYIKKFLLKNRNITDIFLKHTGESGTSPTKWETDSAGHGQVRKPKSYPYHRKPKGRIEQV